jgi:F-type H+-transporting ATPase subunit epsilon
MADVFPTLKLELITLTGERFSDTVYTVILPAIDGEISVFPDHEALVTLAAPGVIAVRRRKSDPDSAMEYFATTGGVIEIEEGRVRVLVDEADHGDDVIEAESQKALDRALAMRDAAGDQVELEKAQQLIDRQRTRLKVAELRRRHRGR